jgi:hypothetical protein
MQGIQDHDEGSIGFRVSSSDEFVFTVPRGKCVVYVLSLKKWVICGISVESEIPYDDGPSGPSGSDQDKHGLHVDPGPDADTMLDGQRNGTHTACFPDTC